MSITNARNEHGGYQTGICHIAYSITYTNGLLVVTWLRIVGLVKLNWLNIGLNIGLNIELQCPWKPRLTTSGLDNRHVIFTGSEIVCGRGRNSVWWQWWVSLLKYIDMVCEISFLSIYKHGTGKLPIWQSRSRHHKDTNLWLMWLSDW